MFSKLEAEQVGFLSFIASTQRTKLLLSATKYRVCGPDSRIIHIKIATKSLISSITFARIILLRIDLIDAISNRRF